MVRQLVAVGIPVAANPVPVVATGQRVAVLMGGHSLSSLWSEEKAQGFDVVVAVNGAAFLFPCDFAVMVDRPILLKFVESGRQPRRGLVTYPVYQKQFVKAADWKRLRFVNIPTVGPGFKSYTAPRAIKYARMLAGAGGTIEVFGMDFTNGRTDAAGLKGDHGPKRWQQEASVLREVWHEQIVAVHGLIAPEKLDYIAGKRKDWPCP